MAEMIAMQQSGLEQLVPASSIPDEDGYEGGLPDGGFRDSSDESSSTQESPVEESNDAGTPSDESDKDSQFLGVVNDEDFVKLLPKIEAAMGSKQSSRGSGMTPGERVLRYQASEFLVQLPQYYKAQGKDGGAPILEKTRKEQRSRKATNSPSTVAQTSLMNPNGTDADPHNQLEAMERLISATGRDRRVTTADRKQVVAMQFARLVEGSQLFRLTAPANIVYVSKEEDLQTVDREEKSTDTLAVLQSRMQVFKDPERERIVYSLIPAIATDDDKEAEFLGQAWV